MTSRGPTVKMTCPVCGQPRSVLRDGTLRRHAAVGGRVCSGSGKRPLRQPPPERR